MGNKDHEGPVPIQDGTQSLTRQGLCGQIFRLTD